MKKMMQKVAILLTGVLVLGTLAGCSKFDASGYVKAFLDNAYKNDNTGIVELEIATAEEATAIYEKGIESLVDVTLSTVAVSEELEEEYRQFYKDLCASVKYTIGEAVEVDKETFEVTVTCEQLNVFADAIASYETKLTELVSVWTEAALAGEEVPSDEEKYEQFFQVYEECLAAELAEASYDEAVSVTVKVELIDNVWSINEEDLLNLEYALIDLEEMFETE